MFIITFLRAEVMQRYLMSKDSNVSFCYEIIIAIKRQTELSYHLYEFCWSHIFCSSKRHHSRSEVVERILRVRCHVDAIGNPLRKELRSVLYCMHKMNLL